VPLVPSAYGCPGLVSQPVMGIVEADATWAAQLSMHEVPLRYVRMMSVGFTLVGVVV